MAEIAPDHRAVMVPLAFLQPNPDDPRGSLGDLESLAASIATVGVLQPLLVVPLDDTNQRFRVVAGHRRRAAAEQAGLDAVPAVIQPAYRDDVEAQAVAAMVENLHRQDLTMLERARGLAHLGALGLSQREMAERVGLSQPTVSRALSVLELPEDIARRVGDDIPVEAVPEMVKLKDHPKALAEVEKSTRNRREDMRDRLRSVTQAVARAGKAEKLRAEAEAKGWKLVKEHRGYSGAPYSVLTSSAGPLARHYGGALDLDRSKHRKEPCHGAYVPQYGDPKLVEVCTKPERHRKGGGSELKAKTQPRRQRTDHEQRQLDAQKARKAAAARRLQYLTPLLQKRVGTDTALPVVARALMSRIGFDVEKLACDLLGLDRPAHRGEELEKEAAKSPTALVRVAFACALAIGHDQAMSSNCYWTGSVEDLYGYLQAHGYEPEEFEARKLAEDKRAEAEWRVEWDEEDANEQGAGDDGSAPGGDASPATGDGADGHDVGPTEPEPAPDFTTVFIKANGKESVVECATHGVVGRHHAQADAVERAQAHLDVVHGSQGIFVEEIVT